MSGTRPSVSLRQWTLAAGAQPVVRIGVILAEDAQQSVEIELAAGGYQLESLAGVAWPGGRAAPLAAGERLLVGWEAGALVVRAGTGPAARCPALRVVPTQPLPLERGAGACVRDVVAGRGFHWQRRIAQHLTGVLELLPATGGIILINELPLEDYLAGVVTAEMGGACPTALLEAQCIVARSWLLALTEPKHDDQPFERCNDDCCQRYQGTNDLTPAAIEAVRGTHGRVLLAPTGDVLDANYSKGCGGISELPRHVWNIDKPGIDAVVDAPPGSPEHGFFPVTAANLDAYIRGDWLHTARAYCCPHAVPLDAIGRYLGRVDTVDNYFRWRIAYTHDELASILRTKLPELADLGRVCGLSVLARGVSGRASLMRIEYESRGGARCSATLESEYRIRQALHRKFLYSSAIVFDEQRDAAGRLEQLTLYGAGWGHGVGMCQIGAVGMALAGHDAEAICRHYYPSARLERVYD